MSLVDVIGWIATCVGALLGLPQLIRLLRTRNLDGLSLFAWRAVLVLNIVWFAHGLQINQPPQLVTNAVALGTTLPLLVLLSRSLGRSLAKVLLPSLAAAAVIIAVDVQLGSLAFGIAAIIPGLLANTGQSIEVVRAAKVTGISPLFLVLAFVNQALWITWAVLLPDPGTIAAAALTLALTAFNLTWYVLRRFGLRPMFLRAADRPAAQVVERELTHA